MKTFRLLAIALAAALLLLSCYGVSTQTTGRLEFALSSGGRSITAGSNLLRVSLVSVKSVGGSWLLQSLYTFPGGLGYAQGSVGSTLTLSNIPVGNWAVFVSAGTTDASGNFVATDYNWPYPVVSVAAGVDNPVSVTLQPSPITPTNIFGSNAPGVVNVGGTVYSATGGQLYTVSGTTATALSGITAPAGVHTNSLSQGYYYLVGVGWSAAPFINTNSGIYYYYSGATSALSDLAATNPVQILNSATFTDAQSNLVIFYENANGFGGAVSAVGSYTSSMWVNVNLTNQAGSNPIYDLTTTQNTATFGSSYAYFASKLGAFQVDQSVVTTGSPNAGNMSKGNFFTVPDGSTILALCAAGNGGGGGNMYIGSTSGGWDATLTESNAAPQTSSPISGLTKVAATSGDGIVRIAATSGASPNYVVFLSQFVLYIQNTGTQNVKVYPFSAGLPAAVTGMTWYTSPASGLSTLYISGRSGPTGTPGVVSISGTGLP